MLCSDKERPKDRVGSGSDNARGSTILTTSGLGIYVQRNFCQLPLTILKYLPDMFIGMKMSHIKSTRLYWENVL